MMPRPMLFVIQGLALAASATAALAAPITAANATGIYASPSASSQQVGSMPAGTTYDGYCQNGWCFVDTPNQDGWVIASDMQGMNSGPGFGFDITIGGGRQPASAARRRSATGSMMTTTTSPKSASTPTELPRPRLLRRPACRGGSNSTFNDAVPSIEVTGDGRVEVCADRNLRGTCTTILAIPASLDGRVNDRISASRSTAAPFADAAFFAMTPLGDRRGGHE